MTPREKAILELVRLSEEEQRIADIIEQEEAASGNKKNKVFQKYMIKDIVFLAIITCCTLVTGAIMPLLVNVPLFGIIQLGLGLQFSLFPVIGMMKVKKPFALLLQSMFISIFLVFMFPPMVLLIACALVAELLTLLIFRGYKNELGVRVCRNAVYAAHVCHFCICIYNVFYTVKR